MLVGMLAGTLAGLFGIGGGLILVPAIVAILEFLKVNPEILMHQALGTSLACIFFNGLLFGKSLV